MIPEAIIALLTQALKVLDNLPDELKTRVVNDMLDDKDRWDRRWAKLLGEKDETKS